MNESVLITYSSGSPRTSLVAQTVKSLPTMQETQVWSLGWEDPLVKEMATHSSILAWKNPMMEEPGRLQSMGSQRVRYDWATSLSLSSIGEGNGNPLQCSCLENLRDGGAWWAAVYGVTQSWTRLKWLSSSSSTMKSLSFLLTHNPTFKFPMHLESALAPNIHIGRYG